jgi:hypothetical protein
MIPFKKTKRLVRDQKERGEREEPYLHLRPGK